MPPASFTCWMSRLLPFFEPRALPSTATTPSWMATTGLMDSTPPGECRRFGDASTLLQILQRIKQRDQADAALRIVELGDDLSRRHALLRQAHRKRHERLLPDGHIRGVHHVHATSPRLRRGERALVRARQLRRQRDDHRLVRAAGVGAPSTPSIVCENVNGDTWLVRGSSSDSTSFS